MDAHQFLARLCALVPPPGFHMTRYYGVFASHHRLREHVIPKPAAPPPPQLPLDFALSSDPAESSPRPRRIRLGKAPRPGLRAGHHPLPKMWRPHARPRGRLRPRRHRPHLARRPRSACASSSRPAPVAPLTARPFGDVFTLRAPLPASLPLSGSSRHISSRARFPSRLGPCQNLPTAGSAAAHRAPPNSPSPPNSHFKRGRWPTASCTAPAGADAAAGGAGEPGVAAPDRARG
jgi:hypothetical protein